MNRRYHYIITIQFEARHGVQQIAWEDGIIIPEPGQTRGDIFRQVFQGAARHGGANPVPLFFSLEPDEL